MTNQTLTVAIPEPSSYGARELKLFIDKFTIRGFIITVVSALILIFIYIAIMKVQESMAKPLLMPRIIDLTATDDQNQQKEIVDLPPVVNTGPAARAGDFVAAADLAINMDSIASFREIQVATSTGGGPGGGDMNNISSPIDFNSGNAPQVNVTIREEDPSPDVYIAVEQEPGVDWDRLNKLVEYPENAKRMNIEGRVTLKVLVQKDGRVSKMLVEQSPSDLLETAAKQAILKYGDFVPALQNKQAVACWLVVPITFRLKN